MSLTTQGVFPSISSYNINPIDHTSHLDVYYRLSNTYGDMYSGVPTRDVIKSSSSLSNRLANPKSAILNIWF